MDCHPTKEGREWKNNLLIPLAVLEPTKVVGSEILTCSGFRLFRFLTKKEKLDAVSS